MWQPAIRTIGDIFRESINQYAIPPFQRAYKWGEEEAIELVEDLKSFPEAGEEYLFLGNFILEKPKDGNIFIIDGQQRLTTIMLLLVACRERAKKLNLEGLATKIQEKLAVTNQYRSSGDLRVRLIASKSIRDVCEVMTKSDWNGKFPSSPFKRQVNKLKPVYDYFFGEVSKLKTEAALGDFVMAIDLSYVVQITIEKRTEALNIFERTNARGRDLDVADLAAVVFTLAADGHRRGSGTAATVFTSVINFSFACFATLRLCVKSVLILDLLPPKSVLPPSPLATARQVRLIHRYSAAR